MKEKETLMDKVSKVITIAGTAILMNFMFLIACIPIVTIGPAWNALLTSVRYNIRGDGWFQGFRFGFKTRFWRSLISWCICLPLCVVFFLDLRGAILNGTVADIILAGVFFAMGAMVTMALQVLNVYVPTGIAQWLRNSVDFFRYAIFLLISAALFWAPLFLLYFAMGVFFHVIMIFVAVYYTLAAVGTTMLLKDGLLDFLLDARANGTLIAEEGSQPVPKDEEETVS